MYKAIILALILSLNLQAGKKNKTKDNDFKSTTLTFYLDQESRKEFKKIPNPKILIFWASSHLFIQLASLEDTNFTFKLYPITIKNDSLFTITINETPEKTYLDPAISLKTMEKYEQMFDTLSETEKIAQVCEIEKSIHDTSSSLYAYSSLILINDGDDNNKISIYNIMSEEESIDPKGDWQIGVVEEYGVIYSSNQKALESLLEFRNTPGSIGQKPCLWDIKSIGITLVKVIHCENVVYDGAKESDIMNIPIKVGKEFKYTDCNWN